MSAVILTRGLTKRFHQVSALDGLDLEVPEGAIYAMVGPNGAGKTTAIKILMNIIRATSGNAEVLGLESTAVRGSAFSSIGYVSENQKLPNEMCVSAFLTYLRAFYPSWDRDLEDELVRKFELPRNRKLKALSRGMRMKVALASSLAYRPRLIVMDEPFGGLDPLVRDELIEGILERASDATMLISSHDLAEMESFATHIGYLDGGHLRFSEEIEPLRARFREIQVVAGAAPALPANLPASWMHWNASVSVTRFIESRFNQERTSSEIRRVFGEVRDVEYTPMSLRSIFLAIAKNRERA